MSFDQCGRKPKEEDTKHPRWKGGRWNSRTGKREKSDFKEKRANMCNALKKKIVN